MIRRALKDGEAILSPAVVDALFDKLYRPVDVPPLLDALTTRLMYLASLLLQRCPKTLEPHQDCIISLAKDHISSEDLNCKHAAYLLCVAYIQTYPTKLEIVEVVCLELLKSPAVESKQIVKSCLHDLVAAVAKGYDQQTSMKWIKDLLLQEGTPQQLIHILQCVERQRDLFCPHWHEFAYRIISTPVRIGLGSTQPETMKIALDLTDVNHPMGNTDPDHQRGA